MSVYNNRYNADDDFDKLEDAREAAQLLGHSSTALATPHWRLKWRTLEDFKRLPHEMIDAIRLALSLPYLLPQWKVYQRADKVRRYTVDFVWPLLKETV